MGAAGGQGGLALKEVREDSVEERWGFEHPEGILVSEQNSGGKEEEEETIEEAVEDIVEKARRRKRGEAGCD